MTPQMLDSLCKLVCVAKDDGAEIISDAAVAYYLPESAPPSLRARRLRKLKGHVANLLRAMACVDGIIDELEGRKPVVPVDEQRAA